MACVQDFKEHECKESTFRGNCLYSIHMTSPGDESSLELDKYTVSGNKGANIKASSATVTITDCRVAS
jgi:hypothetical protein